MRLLPALAAAALTAGFATAPPADARSCKDAVSAKARSAARLSDASREKRARDDATLRRQGRHAGHNPCPVVSRRDEQVRGVVAAVGHVEA
jgi:hypothetical protein